MKLVNLILMLILPTIDVLIWFISTDRVEGPPYSWSAGGGGSCMHGMLRGLMLHMKKVYSFKMFTHYSNHVPGRCCRFLRATAYML